MPPKKTSRPPEDYNRVVWIRDAADGFRLARIVDISQDGFRVSIENSREILERRFDETFSCEENFEKSVDDNCALMHLNEATLLHNCRLRYQKGNIYSYVANILISINPYQPIPGFYSSEKIAEYRGKSIGQKEPHIYAIADKSFREMRQTRESQSIIVSGESGAGKTEAQKAILRYLCENWGADAGPIQQRLLETNPILEAFGNARTRRNNNSSRFGKFVQIHFSDKAKVAGGFVSHYLLETSRICRQTSGERNYHIFYQLIAGSDDKLFKQLALGPPDRFRYLTHGSKEFFSASKIPRSRSSEPHQLTDPLVDDVTDFIRLSSALSSSGISQESQLVIWQTISGILHLGNIDFIESEGTDGGCQISQDSQFFLTTSSRLLGLDSEDVRSALCSRTIKTEGTMVDVALKPRDAASGRDALAKAIYGRLFDYLISCINQSIPFGPTSSTFIGVLDIAGFEFFQHNTFEQFCINYSNEKLQQFFNQRILKHEQDLYKSEGLKVPVIEFQDNQDCIELFESKNSGLFDLLDEEARLPKPSTAHFTRKVHETFRKHFRLDTPRKSKLKAQRELRDDDGFLIRHYAGTVCYETARFLDKNNDALHNSLQSLVQRSNHQLISALFENSKTSGRLKTQSVGGKFKSQLAVLLDKLENTGTHFVRCVKPNNEMKAWTFDGSAILSQLECAGMPSVLRLMQSGFPSRTQFSALYKAYQKRLPPNLSRLDPRLFTKCLFHALGLDRQDFQFGLTKVFFRAGKFAEFDRLMRTDRETMMELISKVNEWLIRERWRKAMYSVWSVIKLKNKIAYRSEAAIAIQSYARGYLIRKRTQKRRQLFRKSSGLAQDLKNISLSGLEPENLRKYGGLIDSLAEDVGKLLKKVRKSEKLEELEVSIEKRRKKMDLLILELKNCKLEEIEKRRKAEEKRIRRENEENIRSEHEKMERKRLEEERKKVDQKRNEKKIEKKPDEKKEKEKLDKMVSTRLATSSDAIVLEPEKSSEKNQNGKMYDLGGWTVPQLRDAINTSNDINLLIACKDEFYSRLRCYNEWKTRNLVNCENPAQNAPKQVYNSPETSSPSNSTDSDRYFKIPSDSFGLWYAHFHGRYVRRQMTVKAGEKTDFLIAGRDDLRMCELPLEETGLLARKGAQITRDEFELFWRP